jgi:hypothetical protein
MKIQNILFIFIAATIAHAINATAFIMIKNAYKEPIIINWNGKDIIELPTNGFFRLGEWPQQIKIRTKNSLMYHSGIQAEVTKAYKKYNADPYFGALIRILDTDNIFNFKYDMVESPPEYFMQVASEKDKGAAINYLLEKIRYKNLYGSNFKDQLDKIVLAAQTSPDIMNKFRAELVKACTLRSNIAVENAVRAALNKYFLETQKLQKKE